MTRGANELLQYFCTTCILLVPVFCGLERTCTPEIKALGPRGTCGGQLTELLSLTCMFNGGYNSRYYKRSSSYDDTVNKRSKEQDFVEPLKTALMGKGRTIPEQRMSKREAFSFLVKKSAFNEQGVVCECCYYRCTYSELSGYCNGGGGSDFSDFFKKRSQSPGRLHQYITNSNSKQRRTDLDNMYTDENRQALISANAIQDELSIL